ncbi:MAG: glutamine synthetase type III [Lentisphaerae bacterium]|jgi:glutamine synthetase|nr:glutamine synthetase type III [Lentisphaerota bacterium]MBT4819229.1 glutamine synthetase type III [Lentisphaerota bacterium]MBT5608936.1 glutamine synthetase type III [Lentisphaerota bacterium]MBT7057340.1 glutamine synthetase type III [Lentisphaerota bacterium]MBT7847083.1 glutamine synthetase type III [Lentisphaerota bacterium]
MTTERSVDLPGVYGEHVFSDRVMRERLPKNTYKAVCQAMDEGKALGRGVADVVANAMKDWAIEKGATHYCHWFQPMTGMTAEKHDSFISPTADGRVMMEFSGKELNQGEPDASSFPSGGLRATFEARGYTAWDCTSPVFVKSDGANTSLFIPSAFCSYNGEALDKKTPLLRSMDALNKQALRVLRVLGNTTTNRVMATLGAEQEYFLIDKRFVEGRLDLKVAGRTLFGAPPPKGQEMDDHYFGTLDERVASFMSELNNALWKLGISAKTQHNEVAPGQYELAPVFATVNVATDDNQITMQAMQKIALRHEFVCLLHEKPFAGVNGSGKHNNWSPDTDDGIGLLRPGDTPHENMQFLVFLFAVIRAVDKYASLLRATVATPGNDHRLGANEAPPAIVSIFLGDQLTEIYEQIAAGGAPTSETRGELTLGVSSLPPLPMDSTDRNRTSPFAFTGSKFEFRMVGSTQSTAGPSFVLNTIVAESLSEIADGLEGQEDVSAAVQSILQRYANEHKRIIFNGDNYSSDWAEEAARRGLPNITNTVDSLATVIAPENVAVLSKHGVLSKGELEARQEILFENYSMVIGIEGRTALQMAKREILPVAAEYTGKLARSVASVREAGVESAAHRDMLAEACELVGSLREGIGKLEAAVAAVEGTEHAKEKAVACRDLIVPAMTTVRESVDALEEIVDASSWPLPSYADMLFTR